jgi:hypothetical protein
MIYFSKFTFFLFNNLGIGCFNNKYFITALGSVVTGLYCYLFTNVSFNFMVKEKIKSITNINIDKNIAYIDKYKDKFDKIDNVYHFKFKSNIDETYNQLKTNYENKLAGLKMEYAEIKNCYESDESESDDSDFDQNDEAEDIFNEITHILKILKPNNNYIMEQAHLKCHDEDKNILFKSLSNNFIIEPTPIGNVIMFYNLNKNGFSYYSDKAISYQYLEVVCRKYVLQFQCKPLFENKKFFNEGRISNFNFIKNNIKHKTKKNATMTFSDFKKILG